MIMSDPTPADRRRVQPVPSVPFPAGDRSGTRLPVPLTSFVGREREIAAVADLLRQDGVRLVTLTGPGGVGKTRLALRVAEELTARFADGTVFVDLAPIRDPALVPPAIAQAAGLREAGDRPLRDQLVAALRPRELLLVLDNLEQVVEAALFLANLLAVCPRVKALVTSRAVLRVTGEHDFPISPLALPEPSALRQPDRVADAPAIRLFAERARAAEPGFALTPETAPAVAAICHRLDGLPLAIELAAARTRHLPPAALLPRLARRLPLLTGGPRDQPARLRTMRDAIAWSHDLLSSEEQALFRRLSPFVGGFTLEAAEAIDAALDGPFADVLEGIRALTDNSLLRRLELLRGEPRYAMLETVREYGLEQLAAADDEPRVRDAHAAFYLALAEAGEPELLGPDQGAWLDRFDTEHANLQAAIAWLVERDRIDDGLRLGAALGWFWSLRGHYTVGQAVLARLLALPGSPEAVARTKAVVAAVHLAVAPGDFAREIALLDEAVTRLRTQESVDHDLLSKSLYTLAETVVQRGEPARAAALVRESLALTRKRGDAWGEAWSLDVLGVAAYGLGDLAGARLIFEEVVQLARRLEDPRFLAVTLANAGWVAVALRDGTHAAARYLEQVPLARAVGDPYVLAWGLDGVAAVAIHRNLAAPAARLLGAAVAIRDGAGIAVPGVVVARREEYVARARARLGEEAFAAAWRAGQALSAADAVAEALAALANPLLSPSSPTAPHGLTPREVDVLRLLVAGRSNQEIGAALFISRRTAATHIQHIFDKLGVDNRTEAAAAAVRAGLV
jgi:non-specific serine/threonine protein kinase